MIGGMERYAEEPPSAVVAAIVGALAVLLGADAGRYRVTSVRPLGWQAADPTSAGFWGVAGRHEAALVHQHFGKGRRP